MSLSRRDFLLSSVTVTALAATQLGVSAQKSNQNRSNSQVNQKDCVFICNEDSNTLSVINPLTNQVETTINLTSFDEDPRPPFRFVTGGMMPTHGAMIIKPLYHGAIHIHGAAPSPDSRLLAVTGRGTSNVYLIDVEKKRVLGTKPNPSYGKEIDVNPLWISSGILLGREPHEPTFTRNGKELWVALRGENRIAILDVQAALEALEKGITVGAVRQYIDTIDGSAQIWFSRSGDTAFVISQKTPFVDVFDVNPDANGWSRPKLKTRLDIKAQDPFGFTPFQKTTPDGKEIWFSHKLADALSARETSGSYRMLDHILLGDRARPNHIEFVENQQGKVVYATFARVDDGGPGDIAYSQVAIIDREVPSGKRRLVGTFFSYGREAHGLWTNPENTRLYIAHELDELPSTPNAGQTVCTVFDVSNPLQPVFISQIPLGDLQLPSGKLRNKKSINLVYVRPGAPSQTA
ncbi:YncE family protein [Pelatocladus sp. BLCC-F211]|uniref:YncE family protein n=1 Tax=Pelatocladus sp. BLCC-F211 TaxID=3342752 RepID=UPI0035BA53E9